MKLNLLLATLGLMACFYTTPAHADYDFYACDSGGCCENYGYDQGSVIIHGYSCDDGSWSYGETYTLINCGYTEGDGDSGSKYCY